MRFLLAALILFSAHVSNAETELVKVGRCDSQGIEMSILAEPGRVLADGDRVTVVSSKVSPLTGLNLSTSAIYRGSDGGFDLPNWTPRALSARDCQMSSVRFHFSSGPLIDELMYIQVFFIYGDPQPDIDIDDLYQRGEAFPFKVHIICRTQTLGAGVLACEQVRILDKIIPVNTSPGTPVPGPRPTPAPTSASSVVKISSGLCGSSQRLESSGVVVDVDGRILVLTSAGAIVSDLGANSCTTATDTNGASYALKLLRHDWSLNLASLEPPQTTPVLALKLRPANAVDTLSLLEVGGNEFAILAESSSRHFIPSLDGAIELQGPVVDSSVVGAPAIDPQGQVAAIVSDSHLKIFPGSLTRPQRWSKADRGNHLIAIPSNVIASWLMSHPPESGRLWVIPDSQFTPPLKMKSGHLVAEENCPPLDATSPHDDYPIGGKDAAGIGGDSTGYRACSIRFSLDQRGPNGFYQSAKQAWHDHVVDALRLGHQVQVPFAMNRKSGFLDRAYLYSTTAFFQEMRDSANTAVDVRTSSSGTIGTDASLAKLRSLAVDLSKVARNVYANFQSADIRIGALIRKAYFFGTLAQSESWSELDPADLDSFVDPSGPEAQSWKLIESLAIGGKRLKKDTIELRDELKKVKP